MDSVTQSQCNDEVVLTSIENAGINDTQEMLRDIYHVWQEFRINSDQKALRAKVVWDHVHALLRDIREEERTFLRETQERISVFRKKIEEISKALQVTPSSVDAEPDSLILKEESLRLKLDSLNKIKIKREKLYKDLKETESKYCKQLEIQPLRLPPNTEVPSEKDIAELEQHVNMLKVEKDSRYKKFCKFKNELTTIMEMTELTPETPLEREILSGTDTLSLTNETFKALEEVVVKIQKKKVELEVKKKILLNKLNVLWQRLKVDDCEKNLFLRSHEKCTMSTIKAIEVELERCEKIKKENLKTFVCSLRLELQDLWEKCCTSESQRQKFNGYHEEDMSDTLLDLHEAEVEKWKSYYQEVKPILLSIEKRKRLWDLMIEFENRANDPNRFKNRKGNLLQEERERKKLQKDLPALENNIFKDIDDYESKSGKPFLYHGEDYRSFVTNQWEERNNQKENEKLERQQKHLLDQGLAVTPMKRPMLATPKSAPSKLIKSSAGMSVFRTPVGTTSKVFPHTSLKPKCSFPKLTMTQKRSEQRVLRERNQQNKPPSPNGTTYTDFASELNRTSRKSLRSSVLCTKKPGGTRITNNSRNKRKSINKSVKRPTRNVSSISSSTTKHVSGLTPAGGKLGLPFLI